MNTSLDLAVTNMHVQKNLVVNNTLWAKQLYSGVLHVDQMETNEIHVKGAAFINYLTITNEDGMISGGIKPNGDFILTAVTSEREWESDVAFTQKVIAGNRNGQWCSVYMELSSSTGVGNGDALFKSIPSSFQPNTKVVQTVSILTQNGQNISTSVGTLIIHPLTNTISFYGSWPPGGILAATLQYFRV